MRRSRSTLRVECAFATLCVEVDAERPGLAFHAERGTRHGDTDGDIICDAAGGGGE